MSEEREDAFAAVPLPTAPLGRLSEALRGHFAPVLDAPTPDALAATGEALGARLEERSAPPGEDAPDRVAAGTESAGRTAPRRG